MIILNVGYDSTNYYLLGEGRDRFLVDIGWPGTLPKMLGALKRKGVEPGEIGYMLATHYHPDHAGLAEEMKRFGTRLIVMETQVEAIPLMLKYTKPRDKFTPITGSNLQQLRFAESASFLRSIGIAGSIIPTPGHSPDCVTLVLESGEAFTGDLTPEMMADPETNPEVAQSWQAIRALGATMIYPGHGPVRPLE